MRIEFEDDVEAARALGHDLYRFSRMPVDDDWPTGVRDGFELARTRGEARRSGDAYQRKWLQLRLSALGRGRFVSDGVTPQFLRRIDVVECPVLRITLTRGTRADTDWSVDRLNNDAAYAPNNLAVMSTRANLAKGDRNFDEVLRLAGLGHATDGIEPAAWLRLAAMMLGPCFVGNPVAAPDIPMPVGIPNFTVRMTTQQLQHLFASRCARHAGKNALVKALRVAMPDEAGQRALQLLAASVHDGLKGLAYPWDVWLLEGRMEMLRALREQVGEPAWGLLGAIACNLIGGRPIERWRLADWRVQNRGYRALRA